MAALLDSHALLWWVNDDRRLSSRASETIEAPNRTIYFSPVNVYELLFKHWLGKLELAPDLVAGMPTRLLELGLSELPLSADHAAAAATLALDNRDPFDRLLVAQALSEDLGLISNEEEFGQTGVRRIW